MPIKVVIILMLFICSSSRLILAETPSEMSASAHKIVLAATTDSGANHETIGGSQPRPIKKKNLMAGKCRM